MKRTLMMLLGIFVVVLIIAMPALSAVNALAATPGAWSPTGALVVARSRHTATLLHDGRVLVV